MFPGLVTLLRRADPRGGWGVYWKPFGSIPSPTPCLPKCTSGSTKLDQTRVQTPTRKTKDVSPQSRAIQSKKVAQHEPKTKKSEAIRLYRNLLESIRTFKISQKKLNLVQPA